MVERGLVTKERCDSDRRGAHVVVTRRGRKEIEAAAPGHVAAVRRLFVDRLTPAQLDAVGAAAEAVLAGLDELAAEDPDELVTASNIPSVRSPVSSLSEIFVSWSVMSCSAAGGSRPPKVRNRSSMSVLTGK